MIDIHIYCSGDGESSSSVEESNVEKRKGIESVEWAKV